MLGKVVAGWGGVWDWDWGTYLHINMDGLHISRKIENRAGGTASGYLAGGLVWMGQFLYASMNNYTRLTLSLQLEDFSRVQKIVMLRNGTFDFDFEDAQISNMCCCHHDTSWHLDRVDCCLFAGCLCDIFLDQGFRVSSTVLTRRGTIKKKNAKPCVAEIEFQGDEIPPPSHPDKSILDSYIESLAQI